MRELSLNVLDIAQNSISANASLIEIEIVGDTKKNELLIGIYDNGKGMTPEQVRNVQDPFFTTRTTRKVGLGIPLFKLAAESTGGSFEIRSEVGVGTTVTAVFGYSHIDRQPLGNMAETILGMVVSHENIDFLYTHTRNGKAFSFDTAEVKKILGGVSLGEPEVYIWLSDYLTEGEEELDNLNI